MWSLMLARYRKDDSEWEERFAGLGERVGALEDRARTVSESLQATGEGEVARRVDGIRMMYEKQERRARRAEGSI